MGRRRVLYSFLQVTDEMMDVRAPALALLLSASGRKVTTWDALGLMLSLERYVIKRVDDSRDDLEAAFQEACFFPADRGQTTIATAAGWPVSRAGLLLDALRDRDVGVLLEVGGGWAVRGVKERYMRFSHERKASRLRTRDNARARAAGWAPGDGKTWVHQETGEVAPTLQDALRAAQKG